MAHFKALVFGGVDGTITSFAVVAGAHFTDDPVQTAMVVGFSSIVADGVSMAVSEFLSSETEATLRVRPGAPATLALLCFGAFVVCGTLPLVLFVATRRLLSVAFFTIVELMLLGVARAIATGAPPLRPQLTTAALGTAAGATAYSVAAIAAAAVR